MEEKLLTAGEFAKLARTTKRTVLWYAEKGVLLPYKVDESGYRFYRPGQIIDFQSVLLMRKLDFSLADIKSYVASGRSLQDLFSTKHAAIEQQLADLKRMLADTDHYYHNLGKTGTLVKPELKKVKAFDIYYIDREGPYAKIKEYYSELRAMFAALPDNAVFLTIFMDRGYSPHKARMRVGVVCQPGMQFATVAAPQRMTIPAYEALIYTHYGSGALLSLLWQELDKYRAKNDLALNGGLPFADLEFYTHDPTNKEDAFITELHLPVLK